MPYRLEPVDGNTSVRGNLLSPDYGISKITDPDILSTLADYRFENLGLVREQWGHSTTVTDDHDIIRRPGCSIQCIQSD
jgi:hypothetical protein